MRLKPIHLFICMSIILILLSACENKLKTFKIETEKFAEELNTVFVGVSDDSRKLAEDARNLLLTKDTYNEPIDDLDISKGGNFKFMNGYYATEKDLGNGMSTVINVKNIMSKPEDYMIREMKLMLKLIDSYKKLMENKKYINTCNYVRLGLDFDIINAYLYYDAFANYPPFDKLTVALGNIDFRISLPYYPPVIKKNNPEKKTIWSKEITPHAVSKGVVFRILTPVYINDTDEDCYGVVWPTIEINVFNKEFLLNKKELYLFSTSVNTIAGASQTAIDALDIKLPYWDYLVSFKNTTSVGDTFKFQTYEEPGMKMIGEKISTGEKEFEVTIKSKKYSVIIADIPENGCKLIGLLKK